MTEDPQEQLRARIRALGNLLGQTIIEQEGVEVFQHEEAIRAQAKAWRAGDRQAQGAITRLVSALVEDIPYTLAVLKAFTTYFQLVNLAEERQRVNVLRQRALVAHEKGVPMSETLADAVRELRLEGLTAEDVRVLLQKLFIVPVFTAHPTETKRRTVRAKLKTIESILFDLDMLDLLPQEREAKIEQLRETLVLLWQSDETRSRPPTVMDEVRNVLYFFENTLYELVPRVYRELETISGRGISGRGVRGAAVLALRFLGGRRPRRQPVREHLRHRGSPAAPRRTSHLKLHAQSVEGLYYQLSSATTRVDFSSDFLESLSRDFQLLPPEESATLALFEQEPYRQKLIMMYRRLEATRTANQRPWDERLRDPRAYSRRR